ncbi:winged helix-turn-helix domain-containing protein [Vibrio owensii]|uniref:winged helix-turn-helix domain-containing protein n=1 Tax=Vibrio owensii TaxID=696485 RepID=UPI001D102CEB|nr:helix-turn-helix domain-containing protein [Vibrio owensii]
MIVELSSNDLNRNDPISTTLTRSEFLLLRELVKHCGQHLSKEHLTHIGWPNSYVGPNSLNMTVMSLRKKLSFLGGFWEISTIQRHGYSLNKTLPYRHAELRLTHYGQFGYCEH